MPSPNTAVSGTSPPTHTPARTTPPAPTLTKNDHGARPHRRPALRVPRSVRRAAGPVGLVAVWFLTSTTGVLPESVLASPVDVVQRAVDLTGTGELPQAIAASGRRAAIGFLIGAAVALVLSLTAGLFRLGEDVIDASMGMFRAIPWVGLIPLFIVWFGIDETPKIALLERA
ncbi:ABC transporter permease, partial [Streptomyces sp. NPDC002814]